MSINDAAIEVLQEEWLLFRHHHPVGAYLPVGQMDGDCHECGGAWPCEPVRKVLAQAFEAQAGKKQTGVPIPREGSSWTGEYL